MKIEPLFDRRTWTVTYLVWDEASRDAVAIDPVLDYDPLRVRVYDESIQHLAGLVKRHELKLHWTLETHAHADHISASARLRDQLGARIAIGQAITRVQGTFKGVFGLGDEFRTDGGQFDRLVQDGDVLEAGTLRIGVITTPGHTPACVTWHIGDALFTGDALFMPDSGTGRCDFPAGSAADLYTSIQKLYALPDTTRVFVGHDYQPGGRDFRCETTIGESKQANIQLKGHTDRESYIKFRTERDATLSPPNLIFPSIQCNIDAGNLPAPAGNGMRYLKLPMGVFGPNT